MQGSCAHVAASPRPGGLSPAYGGLASPGFNYGLNLHSNFSSGGDSGFFSRGSSSSSSSKTVVVKKIETRDGKLVSESSDVLPK